jgi:hypothetical protein
MKTKMTPLEIAKTKLTIPDLARLRGWNWKPGRQCRCPYRPDSNPSGSVLAHGTLFHDFASGETIDAPALLARVEQISNEAACCLFIEATNANGFGPSHRSRLGPSANAWLQPEKPRSKPELPFLGRPVHAEVCAIASLRHLSLEGVKLAIRRGFLFITRFRSFKCWALTDETRWLCQLRRFDGKLFPRRNAEGYKTHTCKGSWQSWPLGIREASKELSIALVEGGADFLAACHFIATQKMDWHVAPVAMLGAGHRIVADALPLFAGKNVRIFAHVDKPNVRGEHPGIEAAARWEQQLQKAGANAATFDLSGLMRSDGQAVKDLNDLALVSPDRLNSEPELSVLMNF